jgi:hypothetical protein
MAELLIPSGSKRITQLDTVTTLSGSTAIPVVMGGIASKISHEDFLSNHIFNKTLVSGSSQIDLTQTTNYISGIKDRLNIETVVSSSQQVKTLLPDGSVSGSSQISFDGIVDKPTLVSSSQQIQYGDITNIPITYYGQISKTTSSTINIGTAGVYQSTGLTGSLDVEAFGIGVGNTDKFAIKNVSGETILVKVYGSSDIAAGNNKVLGIKLALNGVPIDNTECNAPTGTGTSFAKLVTNWMIRMAPNDEVALFVTNFTNSGNVTFQRGRLVASTV